MLRRILLKSIVALFLLQTTTINAKENTHIEGFIERVKLTNQFVTVADIWSADNNFDKTDMLKSVEKAQPLSIDYLRLNRFMAEKNTAINLVLPGSDGETYTVELARYDFLTNDFEVHTMGENNTDTKIAYTPGLYYRGVVAGIPGSVAAFSFFKNEVYGIFSIPNVGNFVVVPNSMVGKEYDYNQHYILYNDQDLKIKDRAPKCGSDELWQNMAHDTKAAYKTTTTPNNKVYANCREVRTFMVADYSMYVKKGSNATNCTNYMTSLYNNMSTLYKNEGISTVLKYTQVNNATDAYQTLPANSGRWLTKFGWVTQNTLHGCDLAMLLTTKYGTMGGVAWLNVMCSTYRTWDSGGAYAFVNIDNTASTSTPTVPTYSWDVEASTHEMGHNLGSPHTHECVWNPPARNTAIDRCSNPISSSCVAPSPMYPSGGGTIMSYCHLVSTGINLSNGFGPQPGDTIRYQLARVGGSCGDLYNPNTGLAVANKTIVANKECTDLSSGITYYWKDNNTADHADDTLALIIRKNGNDIGNLNNTAFVVSTTTLTSYGGGTGVNVTFPSGTSGVASAGNNYSMRRYWTLKPIGSTDLTNPIDLGFPLQGADTTDVNGSVPGPTAPWTNMKAYVVRSPKDGNPTASFPTATSSDIVTIPCSTTGLAANKWIKYPTTTSTLMAFMKISRLGSGGMFYPYGTSSVNGNIGTESGIEIFPNPTNSEWYVSLKESNEETVNFQLYAADGRMVHTQILKTGGVNAIDAGALPTGVYFFRMVSGSQVFTGSLLRN